MAKIIAMVDDLEFANGGRQVEATITRRLAYAGREVELDLTAEHDDELAKLLERYFAAGQATTTRGHGREATRGQGVTSIKRSRAELKAMRDWATGNGLSYTTPKGSTYYGRELLEKWDAHKDGTGLSFDA